MAIIGISPFAKSYIRKRSQQRMTETCRIWKPGPPVLDRDTGKTQRAQGTIKYEGVCRFWETTPGNQALMGDQQVTFASAWLSLPYNAPVPESDDVVKILTSDDTDLVGRTVKVVTVVRGGGLRASRRFLVQVVDSQKDTW